MRMNNNQIMKKCIESNSPEQLLEKVNKFIEENEIKVLDIKEISRYQIDMCRVITFFANITYYEQGA